jgi:hypothetical protein
MDSHMSDVARGPRGISWLRASFCGANECIEVAADDGAIMIRDSKNPDSGALRYSKAEWLAFVTGIKAGEFDQLG